LQQWYDTETGLLLMKTVVGGEGVFYVRDIFGRVLGEYRKSAAGVYGVGKVYTYGADGLVSQRDVAGGASYWYLYGAQEEARALVGVSGVVVNRYEYDPYGVVSTKVEGVSNDFEYTGKHGCLTDDLSGLVLCGQRWYAPVLGRWLSRDPIGFAGGVNLYEYVNGNPLRWIDPSGDKPVIGWVVELVKGGRKYIRPIYDLDDFRRLVRKRENVTTWSNKQAKKVAKRYSCKQGAVKDGPHINSGDPDTTNHWHSLDGSKEGRKKGKRRPGHIYVPSVAAATTLGAQEAEASGNSGEEGAETG
jgi:RHS repeat-associated protein